MGLSNLIFALFLGAAFFLLRKNILKIRRNILVGRDIDRSDRPIERWKMMAKVALGQSKMVVRPVAGILHIIVYVGFVVINIEVLEILIDGLFGTHRVFSFLGGIYDVLIGSFEILAFLVLVACIVFYIRRNVLRIKRFVMKEMDGWPKTDANLILLFEVVLMGAFLLMQAADLTLQNAGAEHYVKAGSFPISSHVSFLFEDMNIQSVHLVERGLWWLHILGILTFMNYLPYSKHFHIVLAFPNTYFAKLDAKGAFTNMASVKAEVEMMMDPSADPYAAPEEGASEEEPQRFGAKDVKDLNWLQLMNAYSCTECGRCTSECPANMTGKLLSPRKIMMDTRDRLEEYGANLDKNGPDKEDGKFLLDDYISREELWACTSCNACTEACPLNIDPLSIILDMRRYLVMEESAAPTELNAMFTNVENNGAPWQFPAVDRLNWKDEA
tara:strand:- start:3473 stop:4798 length:1326 start_codon:yes stop_codon:yes gene_type:complete